MMASKFAGLAAVAAALSAQGTSGIASRSSNSSTGWEMISGSQYLPSNAWSNANWPLQSVGQPLVPQEPDEELIELVEGIDVERVRNIVQTLTNFGTRHTLSQQNSSTRGIGAARDWIYKEMQSFSNGTDMDVYFDTFIQPVADRISFPVNLTNVVARINGTDDPGRAYVVTGHYDSRRIDIMDYTNDAPGSDDDATGVAVVMEMARLCATKRPKATMIFAATAGEEQGLYGSAHLAQSLKDASYNVEGNWNNDIVGTGKNQPTTEINDYTIRLFGASIYYPNASSAALDTEVGIIGGWNDSPAQNLGRFISEVVAGAAQWVGMQVALVYRSDRYLRGGDHESFLAQGFPAVRFTEAVEDFAHQHQDPRVQDGLQYGDLIEFVDMDYTARVARVNLASMWAAANAPGMPRNVAISEVVGFPAAAEDTPPEIISNDSQFTWDVADDDGLVSSYEVVWRPSGALQWTHSVDVGRTGNVTLPLNKDNVQVGVRAVGANGFKSPAVFPLPS
ncbi:peptidase M28 [Xylariaceae sp. FL0804]|nr:peptidase M28 [Xylariaceae sp. FL0804]